MKEAVFEDRGSVSRGDFGSFKSGLPRGIGRAARLYVCVLGGPIGVLSGLPAATSGLRGLLWGVQTSTECMNPANIDIIISVLTEVIQ